MLANVGTENMQKSMEVVLEVLKEYLNTRDLAMNKIPFSVQTKLV